MAGPWQKGETKPRFPPLSTVPWKSGNLRQISTFPPPRLAPHGKVENHKPVSHFPTRPKRRRFLFPFHRKPKNQERKSATARPPSGSFSGSSRIGNVISFQDHPWIGKC